MKIAVLGAGALGCAIGGTLAEAGHELVLINRNTAQVNAINQHGLRMRRADGETCVRVQAAPSAAGLAPVDLVIVLVKSFHTREAMTAATSLVGPQTVVLSLQNGLGHEDLLAEIVGRDQVLAGKTYVGGVLLAPGQIIAGTAGKETLIGELDGRISPRAQAIAEAFNHAGLLTTVSDNIVGVMWDKLLINVATGAVSSITGLVYGELYAILWSLAMESAALQDASDAAAGAP